MKLGQDEQEALLSAMKEVARKFGNNVYKQIPEDFRRIATPGLKFSMGQLTEAQKQELGSAVRNEATDKLKELAEEAGMDMAGMSSDVQAMPPPPAHANLAPSLSPNQAAQASAKQHRAGGTSVQGHQAPTSVERDLS